MINSKIRVSVISARPRSFFQLQLFYIILEREEYSALVIWNSLKGIDWVNKWQVSMSILRISTNFSGLTIQHLTLTCV